MCQQPILFRTQQHIPKMTFAGANTSPYFSPMHYEIFMPVQHCLIVCGPFPRGFKQDTDCRCFPFITFSNDCMKPIVFICFAFLLSCVARGSTSGGKLSAKSVFRHTIAKNTRLCFCMQKNGQQLLKRKMKDVRQSHLCFCYGTCAPVIRNDQITMELRVVQLVDENGVTWRWNVMSINMSRISGVCRLDCNN